MKYPNSLVLAVYIVHSASKIKPEQLSEADYFET